MIRDSVIVSTISMLIYGATFVPGLADIFDRMTQWSVEGRRLAESGEAVSGSCSVKIMRFITILAMYAFTYMVITGKFVPAK